MAGDDAFNTSITGGQYSSCSTSGTAGSSTYSYNHEAETGQRWTLPLGAGVSKTAVLGAGPWKFGLEHWYYLEQPDAFGPDWQIRLSVSPLVPLPWGG